MRQLEVANARLLSLARERQRLKDDIASLTALLKSDGSANQGEKPIPTDVE